MDEDTRRRCLEPFYTTKGERGTGLGLAMVYGMIQRHSAELEIDSAAGQGHDRATEFPGDHLLGGVRRPAIKSAVVVTRRLRILLVDDDPLLIKSLQDTLQEDGHHDHRDAWRPGGHRCLRRRAKARRVLRYRRHRSWHAPCGRPQGRGLDQGLSRRVPR